MYTVICKEVVVASLLRRGTGERHSPIRVITQVFEKDGTLIAENDPCPEDFAIGDLTGFAIWCSKNGLDATNIAASDVYKWLDAINLKPSTYATNPPIKTQPQKTHGILLR